MFVVLSLPVTAFQYTHTAVQLGGSTNSRFFVEVPIDCNKPIPDGYEIAEIPPCTYLYFNGMPYDNPNDFPQAIGILNEAIAAYPFEKFGWKRSDNAPLLGMGAEADTGARIAVPVERIRLSLSR